MGRKKISGLRQNPAQEDIQILWWVGVGVGPGLYLQAGQHWSPMGLQGLRCQWPGLAGPCHHLHHVETWRGRWSQMSSHPVSGRSPLKDWTCPAHWVEQAWEPVSSGKRLPCLPASSKLWLGLLAGGVCVRRRWGLHHDRMERKLGHQMLFWRPGQIVPRDQSPLEKDHPGNQAHLGLWQQFAGERGTSAMFRAGTLDGCSAPKLQEEFMAAQQMD